MKITRRQLKKIILESIDEERSEPVINKLTEEKLEKLKGLLTPYLNAIKENREYITKNTEEVHLVYKNFVAGEEIINTLLEGKENPGDYPGVVKIYNKILKPYYLLSIREHLNVLSEPVLYFINTFKGFEVNVQRTPDDFTWDPDIDFSKQEELFRKGMEMLVKLFKDSDGLAPVIYREKVLKTAKICDLFIDKLIKSQKNTNDVINSLNYLLADKLKFLDIDPDDEYFKSEADEIQKKIEREQKSVNYIQKLLDGESVWVVIKKIINDYPISIDGETQNTAPPNEK